LAIQLQLRINFIEIRSAFGKHSSRTAQGVDRMFAALHRVLKDESGVTAIEYAFLASLIAVAIAGVVGTVGSSLSDTFTTVANDM
jgi:pilus assembly protein Flp/PilA